MVINKAKISCKGVWKLYGDGAEKFFHQHQGNPDLEAISANGYIPAVKNVTFDVQVGKILVVMGLSGSGKTTLLRCLSRLIEPTGGDILFDGENLLNISDSEMVQVRRHKMGMVFQNFALLPHRTVIDNVAFPLEIQGIARANRYEKAQEIIELVGLKGRDSYYPRELSGGQQQRVGIARALSVNPDVLFLDEPFSALDPLIRREMQNEFLRLQNKLQKTIVFVTHDFDEAIRLADQIAIMYGGEIVQEGTAEELVLKPATNYVREFTRDIPKGKLLTVGSIMAPHSDGSSDGLSIKPSELISNVAAKVIGHDGPVVVVDEKNNPVGSLSRDQVVEVLFSKGN